MSAYQWRGWDPRIQSMTPWERALQEGQQQPQGDQWANLQTLYDQGRQRADQASGAMAGGQGGTPYGIPGQRPIDYARPQGGGDRWFDAPPGLSPETRGPDIMASPPLGSPQNPYHATPSGQGAGTGGSFGAFGTTYQDPGGGWSPWMIYDGREGYNGQAVDGHYDQTKDTNHWQVNGAPENDRNRVWRWTLDQAKAEGWDAGAAQNDARLKQAFLNNVARLKRDYMDTPGLGAQAWANSAFAGYDRMPGTQGGQQATPAGAAAGQQGGNTVNPAIDNGGAGSNPGGATQQRVGSGTYNTSTGTSTIGGGLGAFQSSDWLTALNAAKDNPAMAAHILRLAQGQKGRVTSRLGQYADNLYGRALQAYLNVSGLQGSGIPDMQQGIQGFYGAMQGNNLIDYLNNAAGGIMGANFTGMDDADIETALRSAIALRSLGVGSLAGSQLGSALDNILYAQEGRNLGGREFDTADNNLGTLLSGSLFDRYMRQFNQSR